MVCFVLWRDSRPCGCVVLYAVCCVVWCVAHSLCCVVRSVVCCVLWCHHEVSSQESLQEATLAAADGAKHITTEDVALGLLLLQVNLLVPSHCRGETKRDRGSK